MVILQGDVFWVRLPAPSGSEPGYRRPVIVVQNDAFTASTIRTVVVCMVTTNLRLADAPGNVLLSRREANLPKRSVANVSQIMTVDKTHLAEKIGRLSAQRLGEILAGVGLVVSPVRAN